MKGIIVYKGKYGATAKYAEWLKEELSVVSLPSAQCTEWDMKGKGIVVMGSSVYIGKLQIAAWLKANAPVLMTKLLFLFVVSATPLDETEKLAGYIRNSVPAEIASRCHIYFLPGRLCYKRLSWKDKFMLRMGAMLSGNKETKRKMLTDYDNVHKENLQKLLADIKVYGDRAKVHAHA